MEQDDDEGNPEKRHLVIRPCNNKELAAMYKVSPYTIRNWLKPFRHKIGKRTGYTYTVHQVIIILDCLGPLPG